MSGNRGRPNAGRASARRPDRRGRLEAATREFRALDYRHGGGSCRDAVQVLLPCAELMLLGVVREPVMPRLCTAVADLYNLSGWTGFDDGRPRAALAAFERALELARIAGDDELVADVCYRIGRLHLHYGAVEKALNQFDRGQAAAARTNSMLARAILSANLAWAQASGVMRQRHWSCSTPPETSSPPPDRSPRRRRGRRSSTRPIWRR